MNRIYICVTCLASYLVPTFGMYALGAHIEPFMAYGFLIALLCAVIFALAYSKKGNVYDGAFRINHSDPTKDLCTLELESDLDEIEEKGEINLKVFVIPEVAEFTYTGDADR